jgi:putative DNA primase/helicase
MGAEIMTGAALGNVAGPLRGSLSVGRGRDSTITEFQNAMRSVDLEPPRIEDDGKLHRFSSNGKCGDDSGWYCLHSDGIPAGSFGDWRTGLSKTWRADSGRILTAGEQATHRVRMDTIRRERKAGLATRHLDARARAATIWAAATTCNEHPYLTRKGIQPNGARMYGDVLVIPMRDSAGTLHSLQFIETNNDKRFLYGGRVKACYFDIGKPSGTMIVCEGFATGASVYECTGQAVAVAFNADNLRAVATELRARFPELRIIIAADDDYRTDGNPGRTKALEAARDARGLLAVPEFAGCRPDGATDFNDLHQSVGTDAVKACIDAAVPYGSTQTAPAGDDWPEPAPLSSDLPAVQAFFPGLLPEELRGWLCDVAERMQCPLDFPAVGAIVALSSLIGPRAKVQPKERDDWFVTPNLWALIIGNAGVMKSPALSEVLKPLQKLESQWREQWQGVHEDWVVQKKAGQLRADANEKEARNKLAKDRDANVTQLLSSTDEEPEPVLRRLIVNDTTMEALGEVLESNPGGVLAHRDEIYGLLRSIDKEGQEGARAFYLQAFDGDKPYTFDRIGRGLNKRIERVCVSMLGAIQPGRISEYVRVAVAGGAGDDGLMQRFQLTVWPDISSHWRNVDRYPDTTCKQAAYSVYERLGALPDPSDATPLWRFDKDAQGAFNEWREQLEPRIRGEELHPAMVAHLSKYRKLVPALALIFTMIDAPDTCGIIPEQSLIRALAWAEYLESHAVRLYAAATRPDTAGAATLLKRIKSGVLGDKFTVRDVYLKGWTGLNSPEAARKAAAVLAEFDWLRRDTRDTGGRPSEAYQVNPAARQR